MDNDQHCRQKLYQLYGYLNCVIEKEPFVLSALIHLNTYSVDELTQSEEFENLVDSYDSQQLHESKQLGDVKNSLAHFEI